MEDLINLLETELETVNRRIERRNGSCYHDETNKLNILDGQVRGLEKAIEIVKQYDGWIPVSERLPTIRECIENDFRFIVTDGNKRYQACFNYEEDYFEKYECNGKIGNCVIAWQLLPEPYKINNFECRYIRVSGTFCFRNEINMLNGTECSSCEINNSCEYCDCKTSHSENCKNCIIKVV